MINKKNKLFTFLFSLIPGAGEMYLGFYKTGISIMILFWGDVALFGFLFPPMLYLLPVLWFYSFFHTHNLNGMPDEEFYALEDDYLFHLHPQHICDQAIRYQKPLAFVLILMGCSIIWNRLVDAFWYLSEWFPVFEVPFSLFRYWSRAIPQLAVAFLILWIGWKLIQDKKEILDDEKLTEEESERKQK